MGRIEKTVFISYRRTDEPWALAIFQDLTQHGYDVFIDYDGIASGSFETAILENIKARAHFLVLLTPTALEPRGDSVDWMRREIEAALDSQRNIVPLMLAGFNFAAASQLTGKLAALKKYNGLSIPAGFFQEAMGRVRNRFLNVPVDAVLHSPSDSAQQVAKEQKDKATMALGEEQNYGTFDADAQGLIKKLDEGGSAKQTAPSSTVVETLREQVVNHVPDTTETSETHHDPADRTREKKLIDKERRKRWLTPRTVAATALLLAAAVVGVLVFWPPGSISVKEEGTAASIESARRAAEVQAANAEKARQAAEARAAEAIAAQAKSEQARRAAEAKAADAEKARQTAEAAMAQQQTAPAPAAQPPQAKPAPAALPKGVDPQNAVFIDTKYGRIVIKLRPDLAPKHVERIKQLARDGFYDNVPFHRVIAGFMAQTGDGQNGDGTGGSKYPNLPAEFSNVPYTRGVVGMARTPDDHNSANSQFFIMLAESPLLNGKYTVVGEVVSGMDVVDEIKKGPDLQNGAVPNPDKITRMQVAADAK